MPWPDVFLTLIRAFVNDMDETNQTYSDDQLLQLAVVGSYQVAIEMTFSQQFAVDVVKQTIKPDPTIDVTNDTSFVNLSCLKAATIFDRGQALTAVKQAIVVRDGSSAVDLRGPMEGKLKLLLKGGWSAVYDDAKLEYKNGLVRVAGAAIMTPFRLYALGYDRLDAGDRYNRTILY